MLSHLRLQIGLRPLLHAKRTWLQKRFPRLNTLQLRVIEGGMRVAILAVVLIAPGCSGAGLSACVCPKPISYDEDTLTKISQALRALPADNVLRQAMEDYENERDDLRFCPRP